MCGIVGISTIGQKVDHQSFERMRDTLKHRGPDDAGLWVSPSGTLGLAQRRLSIIDLSPPGPPPNSEATGKYTHTFNGPVLKYI